MIKATIYGATANFGKKSKKGKIAKVQTINIPGICGKTTLNLS